uniref:solute carrier family 25 member 47 isoform X2 n=1 Tax=Halichoerus grypus TaxID=9711 RepID=UPI0016592396|nr:solute carrier family 25 member 47 isoform X2 [Halichoerus grypus]
MAFIGSVPLHTHTQQRKGRRTLHRLEDKSCLAWRQGPASVEQRLSQNASLAFGTRHGWAKTWKEKLLAAWLNLSFLLCISTLRVDETRCGQEVWVYSQRELVGFSPASCCETGSGSSASSPGPSDFLPGVCGVAVGYPLDTVKVKIQTEPKYRGIWHCVWDTYRQERVFLTSPTEVAKVRLQTQTQTQTQQRRPSASWPSAAPPMCPAPPACSVPGPKYRGPLHCLATVAREEGLRGLYKGSSALLFRDGHSFATYFLSYAILCEQLTPTGHSQPDVLGVLVAGGCAGVLAWAVATPMDVIKSRLQADGQGQRRYRGLLHCVVTSVREDGPRVLFKGLTLNCCRAFPVNMVVFVAYEAVLRLIRGLST